MNNYTISLSSNVSEYITTLSQLSFDDFTQLSIDMTDVYESILPMYMKIDWGDNSDIELFDNDVYRDASGGPNILNYSPIFSDIYKHQYTPSTYALYKQLSAQILIRYVDGSQSWFIIPIKIRTYDHFESIGDMKIIDSNILPTSTNTMKYHMQSSIDNQIIELIGC